MRLDAGKRLGPYEILMPIGAGGMGEVYRAIDTRLGREVAVKVSAERFGERFEREARVIASLNHPNICTLHDVGPDYLVMELVEGATLADRIKKGPIPFEEALGIARQVADALETAHDKGVVHRDLKPSNIKLKPDGTVKVLDFGLAKLNGVGSIEPGSNDSPTIMGAPVADIVLGTAAYMSPEQAKGQPVDQRSDIWSFGVVLYEMVSGKRLFAGETTTDVLASVLKEEPRWERVPAQVQRLLKRCLEKDPHKRLRHIGDALALVDERPAVAPQVRRGWPAWALAIVLLVALGVVTLLYFQRPDPSAGVVRFEVEPPDETNLGQYFDLSPDGRRLAFLAVGPDGRSNLWVREFDSVESTMLPGTQGARTVRWSPDSRQIAFFAQNRLHKVNAAGDSPPQLVFEVAGSAGSATWNDDDLILFGGLGTGTIRSVSADGGPLTELTTVDPARREAQHGLPSFLPDGRHFLYLRLSADPDVQGIYVGSIDLPPEQQSTERLLATQYQASYVEGEDGAGYLVYLRDSTLVARPFDAGRLELTGESMIIAEGVGSFGAYGFFSMAGRRALAYRSGEGIIRRPTWFDRQGNALGAAADPGVGQGVGPALELAPDGNRLATDLIVAGLQNPDIWLMDFTRGVPTRLTFTSTVERWPIWSPDGTRLIFVSIRDGRQDLYQKAASGAGNESLLLESSGGVTTPTSWSSDGRFVLYGSSGDIFVLPMESAGKPFAFLQTDFTETQARFSPDGKWVVYVSNESTRAEVYLRAFVTPDDPSPTDPTFGYWPVSRSGGNQPRWRRDGKQIYYRSPDNTIMAVDVNLDGELQLGVPQPLFSAPPGPFDVSADGERFLIGVTASEDAAPLTVVVNWAAQLSK
jgi:eukaryotic-like serine/threonine-protein kinase